MYIPVFREKKEKYLPSIIPQYMMPATAPSLNKVKFILIYSLCNDFLKYKFHDFKYLPLGRNKLTFFTFFILLSSL